ncbi:MAG: hypothetical protein QT11_C0001G0895 [archaeon GW2011_AR20]|nr:MAG: hypothetical protein QT11_C0001G0895 [archaeon GW2011_AR20]
MREEDARIFEDEDIYTEEGREKELEDDELEDWQEAWMAGYDGA